MTRHVRIERSIWKDEDWRGLTSLAQWLYFTRVTTRQAAEFSAAETAKMASDLTPEEVELAALELGASKFAHVLNRRRPTRAHMPKWLRREVFEHDGWACVQCGSTGPLEVDHIIPVKHGGTDDRANLQTLCAYHNRKKGASLHALVQD